MYYIVVNPKSKTGKGISIWKRLEPLLTERSIEYRVVLSKKAGHVTRIVRELCERLLTEDRNEPLKLLILGGDGTLNEALQGITDFSRVDIGYIPTGSSNDMARDLRLPADPVEALENILSCEDPLMMDLGVLRYEHRSDELSRQHNNEIGDIRLFGVSAGIGYDAAVCEEALASPMKNFLNKLRLGKLTYLSVALKQLIRLSTVDAVMTLDDEEKIELSGFYFAACMIHQYEGGGFQFCPGADYTDGVFDIISASGISKMRVLTALPFALKGKHFRFRGVNRYSAKKVLIETKTPLWVHTDGEVSMKSDRILLTSEKQKIRILR